MKQLVLIHGALGNQKEFHSLLPYLEHHFIVHLYEIPGHGERDQEIDRFDMTTITTDLRGFLQSIGESYIFGFSLGGYLAIYLASTEPKNILGIVTLGTKFQWSPEIAQREIQNLDYHFLKEKAPSFFEYLNTLHGNHFESLLSSTAKFMSLLGSNPLLSQKSVKNIRIPIHITRGGKDKMVTCEESLDLSNALQHSNYFEIPSFIHPIGFIKPKHLANHIIVQVNALDYNYAKTTFGEIAYSQIGLPKHDEEPILLFLHEALGSIAQWQDFPSKISSRLGFSAIIPEMLGYGFSGSLNEKRKANYLHQFAWQHIPALLDELGIKNKLLLIGHSDGGSEALLFASKYSDRIAGVVTMAAHIENEPETKAGIYPAIEAFHEGKLKGLEVYHGEKTSTVFNAWSQTWLDDTFSNWNLQNELQKCEFPALIIQGEEDQYGTLQQVEKIVTCLGSKAESFIISNCGHSPHLEQQELVIEKIATWNKQ